LLFIFFELLGSIAGREGASRIVMKSQLNDNNIIKTQEPLYYC